MSQGIIGPQKFIDKSVIERQTANIKPTEQDVLTFYFRINSCDLIDSSSYIKIKLIIRINLQ